MAMREAIQNIAVGPDRGRNISREMARNVMDGVLKGEIDQIQVAVFLIALRMKRESMDEFLGIYDALSARCMPLSASVDSLIVLADPFDGYVRNVTMTPFLPSVLAACGYACVIHGVESVGPKHGVTTHKVVSAAGGNPVRSTAEIAESLEENSWAYIDQSVYAPDLYKMANLRNTIVKRTAITTLERLLMPLCGKDSTHLVLGYVHKAYPEIYATVAKEAGFDRILLLKGVEGGLAPALNKPLRRFFFETNLPENIQNEKQLLETQAIFDAKMAAPALLPEHKDNAVIECLNMGLDVLSGKQNQAVKVARQSLCLAAGQILDAHNNNLTLASAVENVEICLDNGSALQKFNDTISC